MKNTLLILLFLLQFSIYPLYAQNNNNNNNNNKSEPIKIELANEPAIMIGGLRITLGSAIRRAIESNHDILSGSYDVAMTDSMYKKFLNKYSISLNGSTGFKYAKYPSGVMQMYEGVNKKALDFSVGVKKSFSTGTTITGGVFHEYYKRKNMAMPDLGGLDLGEMFGPEVSNTPNIYINIHQELLKNAFGYSDRKQMKILKNAARMQKEAILYGLSLVVVGIIGEYWNVVLNKSAHDNAILQLKEIKKVRNIMARNVYLGLADSFNLNYYNALVSGAEAQKAMTEQKYKDAMRSFLRTVNLKEGINIEGTVILSNKVPKMNIEESLKIAYHKRADYNNALLALKNAKLGLDIARNNALPSLIAELNTSTISQRENFGSAWGDTGSVKYPSIEARLRITYPLDDKAQKINERNSRFMVKQAKINLEKSRRIVKDDIIGKIEQINTYHTLYEKAKNARIQSNKFYRKMLRNLRKGRLTAAVVKNGVDALVQSRQSELQALVLFNISLLQLDVSRNQLYERFKINVNKYIPKGK
ncbi:TolC family protein [Spirochaetota bacterium]